jgi:hypothetical protein
MNERQRLAFSNDMRHASPAYGLDLTRRVSLGRVRNVTRTMPHPVPHPVANGWGQFYAGAARKDVHSVATRSSEGP